MAVRYRNAPEGVDPVEQEINLLFDRIVLRVNERRISLLATAREKRRNMRKRETRRDREQKLLEVRTPLFLVFKSQPEPLELLIAGLGEVLEVLEEQVPIVPRYKAMIPVLAVEEMGKAPGELYCPKAVAIETNSNRIYVAESGHVFESFARISIFSEGGEYINSYTHQDLKSLHGIAIHGDSVYACDTSVNAVFQIQVR